MVCGEGGSAWGAGMEIGSLGSWTFGEAGMAPSTIWADFCGGVELLGVGICDLQGRRIIIVEGAVNRGCDVGLCCETLQWRSVIDLPGPQSAHVAIGTRSSMRGLASKHQELKAGSHAFS